MAGILSFDDGGQPVEAFSSARWFEVRGLDAALAAYFGVEAAAVPAVTLPAIGGPGSTGYQPMRPLTLRSEVVLRNASQITY